MGTTHPSIPVRKLRFEFDDDIPRYWFGGNPFATHLVNAVNLLFPAGERMFVRSVKHYAAQLDDPELRERVRGFYGQEGNHAREHERYFTWMERRGYRIRPFLKLYERIAFTELEPRLSPELRLAVTAALEHYTALMAEGALGEGAVEDAHPKLRALLKWHAAEELEHKAVAYDVLMRVHPSYANRMAGLVLATAGMVAFWAAGVAMLLRQDGLGRADVRRARSEIRAHGHDRSLARDVFLAGIRAYVRRDFHPNDADNYHLASDYLRSIDLERRAQPE